MARTRARGVAAVAAMAWAAASAIGCGGAPSAADGPAEAARATSAAAAEGSEPAADGPAAAADETPQGMPDKCGEAAGSSLCLPPPYFAKALCNADFPTVAVAMFAHGTPWKRAYSVTTSPAWNASGGASSNEKMKMYEEILVLRHRAPAAGGIEVSGAGDSYDVLRWDGSCVTLQKGELVFDTPPKVTSARVVFKHLETHVRDALKGDEILNPLYVSHRKECKGVTMGVVSKECEKLDASFSEAIARRVREIGGVPTPHKLPQP